MDIKARIPAALILLPLLSGCMSMGPRLDPYAGTGLESLPPAFPDLRLAMVLSENTRKTLQMNRQGGGSYDVQGWEDKMFGVYKRNFKEAFRTEDVEEARQSVADLIAIIDDYSPKMGFVNRQESTVIFLTKDNRKLDEIKAAHEQRMGFNVQAMVDAFSNSINRQIETGIRGSQALADFAKTQAAAGGRHAPAAAPAQAYVSDVDSPAYSRPGRPDDFALVVGIEKYSGLPDADFAERDAAAMHAHLLALGFPERNVVFLRGSQAVKSGIEKYVESWLPRNVKADSKVLFYFSGHGAPDPANGQAYLVPWDGDAKFLENTGYPLERLYRKLNALQVKEVLVAMDACFSGYGGHSVIAQGTRPLVTKVDDGRGSLGRVVVLSASSLDEVTGTEEPQGHGLFTYNLLKGLQQAQGQATVRDLYEYLKPKVQDAARRQNRDQTPQLLPADSSRSAARF
ncbi:MAG: caspase family protein [Elusimicrobia bacterium]|nr:caspase family protein [Elusimicrobiota bacterium]